MRKVVRATIAVPVLLVVLVGTLGFQSGMSVIPFEGDFRSMPGGGPDDGVYSIRFAVYDGSGGGSRLWPVSAEFEEHPLVIVMGGKFSVELGSGGQPMADAVFQAEDPHLQISVCQPAGFDCEGFETLSSRLPLSAQGDGGFETPLPGSGAGDEGDPAVADAASVPQTERAWLLSGNAGTSPAVDFLGTTDGAALSIGVDGRAVLRIEPHATSPNLVGGHPRNSVTLGAYGATISGGGVEGYPHLVDEEFGTIGGGEGNRVLGRYGTIAGGQWNQVGNYAAVGGGNSNSASGWNATIPGGGSNTASADSATVGGGRSNEASGAWSTVAGGVSNEALGSFSFVAGGQYNVASGDSSFAAGAMAKAEHPGSFVWADSLGVEYKSTEADQFLVRASGGAVFNVRTSRLGLVVVSGIGSFASSVPNPRPYYVYSSLLAANEREGPDAIGVWGHAGGPLDPWANPGQVGVYGSAVSGFGVVGITDASAEGMAAGLFRAEGGEGRTFAVYGDNFSGDEGSAGGFFKGATGLIAEAPYSGIAILARVRPLESGDATGYGVFAEGGRVGVYGQPRSFVTLVESSGRVAVERMNAPTYGVYGKSDSPYGYGVYSEGNSHVEGALTWEPKKSYMSVGPWAFDTHQWWGVEGSTEIQPPIDCPTNYLWDGVYFASAYLPHGVRLTKIEFHWKDGAPAFDCTFRLRKTDLEGGIRDIAVLKSRGSDATAKSYSYQDLDHVVDNRTGSYLLSVDMGCDTWFYGVVIEYEVSEPY